MCQTRHPKLSTCALVDSETSLVLGRCNYFQGTGGGGAPPFFQGTGGGGAPPFFHGTGGGGAPPLAMITEPSLWVMTTVFKLIAPTKTSMERNTTISLRDIVPPVRTTPGAC